MKVYIAGVISDGGRLDEAAIQKNMELFTERAEWLRRQGHEPLNPCENVGDVGWTWRDWMKAALRMLLEADGISLLPGWVGSKGATLEWDVARRLDYQIVIP